MNPERYRRLDELFRGALALAESERSAWLAERCQGDAQLRAEVEALLAHDRAPRLTLADSPGRRLAEAAAGLMEREGDAAPPLELEGYRFLRRLGTGGMGVVWEAEEVHPPRRVAIKVLRPGLATTSMLRRFAVEIHALARMDHPGIARILDAGVAEVRGEPRPYLVMELRPGRVRAQERWPDGAPRLLPLWTAAGLAPNPPGAPILFEPDGELLVCASRQELAVLRAGDGSTVRRADFRAAVMELVQPRSGGPLAVLTRAELLEVEAATLAVRRALALPCPGSALAADGRGGWLLGGADGRLFRLEAGISTPTLLGELGSEVMALALSPDGRRLAIGTRNGLVRLWRTDSWSPLLDLDPHVPSPGTPEHFYVRDLDWSSDGTRLVSCSGDGTARVWDSRPSCVPSELDGASRDAR